MENSTKQIIVAAVKEYMAKHNLTQADVSRKADVRKEYLNIILKENSDFMYDAGGKKGLINIKVFNQLADLVGFSIQKVYWQPQPTEQMVSVIANLEEAKKFGSTGVITGETGAGKTYAVNLFAKKYPLDTFIVTVGSTDTLGDLIDKIIDALKISTGKSKSKKLRDVAKRMKDLKSQGFNPQLIFDESEYMKQPALCSMKELYDNFDHYCSIMLVGTDQLTTNIEKLQKRNKAGIPQLYRRIKFGIRVLPVIDRRFDLFVKDIQDKALIKFITKHCDNYGELHDVLVPTLREADRTNEPITEALMRRVLNINQSMFV
jgi:DNA transposition AAA+ family ATPase